MTVQAAAAEGITICHENIWACKVEMPASRNGPVPAEGVEFTRMHIRMLLALARLDVSDLDNLAVQLTTALEGPILLAMYMPGPPGTADPKGLLADSWQTLAERVCRP